ncbi:hypothetical protein [Niveispirillum fermenti]|uniref:hypothetical protein n=1 Tax=Niveispirillum fermenti TaxID=1233113 RepID=UPI003A83EA17
MSSTDPTFGDNRRLTPGTHCRPASFVPFSAGPPQILEADGTPTWIARGANFVVAVSRVAEGAQIVQPDIPDESMLLLSPAIPVTVGTGDATRRIGEEALAILPPGTTRLTAHGPGLIVRILSGSAAFLRDRAANAAAYAGGAPDVAPLESWPAPPDGFRLRVYPLRDYMEDVGFGRLFRSTNLMVNIFQPSVAARDPARLSPHDHADFEQGSLTLEGDFTHHLRTPWGADRGRWRADEHLDCTGCSLVVIPPRMIHTTGWHGAGARLVDIFAPPRDDFALKPRWVRNADDYPLPPRLLPGGAA